MKFFLISVYNKLATIGRSWYELSSPCFKYCYITDFEMTESCKTHTLECLCQEKLKFSLSVWNPPKNGIIHAKPKT